MKTIGLMLIGVVILIAIAIVLAVVDRGLEPEPTDHRDLGLPDRPLNAADVAGLRFRVGWRGYRMEDVDAALDQLTEALRVAQGGAAPTTSPYATAPLPESVPPIDSADATEGLDILGPPEHLDSEQSGRDQSDPEQSDPERLEPGQ